MLLWTLGYMYLFELVFLFFSDIYPGVELLGTPVTCIILYSNYTSIKKYKTGLPWWCSGWESACQCRGHGFEPWSGGIPHAAEQLGPWATITEPVRLEPVLRSKRGHDSERPVHRDEEWPPLATTRESPRTQTKTQHSHTYIHTFKKKNTRPNIFCIIP